MQQLIIGSKNQIVIPKEIRQKIAGIKPGRKVTIYPLDNHTVALKVTDKSWLENSYGAMTEAWKNIDPIKQLEKIRNQWS